METIFLFLALQSSILDAAAFGELADPLLKYNDEDGWVSSDNLCGYAYKYGLHNGDKNYIYTISILRYWYSEVQTCPQIYEMPLLPKISECYRNYTMAKEQLEYYKKLQGFFPREIPQLIRQNFRSEVWSACYSIELATSVAARDYNVYRIRCELRRLRDLIGSEAFMRWEIPGPIE